MKSATQGRPLLEVRGKAEPACELGDLLIAYLEQLGVEFVFGIPGGAIEPLYNALARSERRGGPRPIVSRHETGAAFMAHGYFSNSGKLGVCCSTTGPGATNLLTGVASAYENHVPLLVITAQTALSKFGHGAFQDSSDTSVNTIGMFQHCTKYNTLVSHPDQFERKVYTAIMTALQTQSPVHLSVPTDIFKSEAASSKPSFDLLPLLYRHKIQDYETVNQLTNLLLERKKIVFVIGDECADSIGTILSIAILLKAEIITTPHGKGMVSPYHPLYRGVIGFSGHRSAEKLLSNADVDLIVAIGTSLGEWTSSKWTNPDLMRGRLVHVEAFENRFSDSPAAILHVLGELTEVFGKILLQLLQEDRLRENRAENHLIDTHEKKHFTHFEIEEEYKCHVVSKPIKPQRLMYKLADLFPPQTFWLADVGNSFSWSVHYLHPYDRRLSGARKRGYGIYRSCFEFASMGWAIGASVGVSLARRDIPVVCITGDGSWLMNGQESTVALQERLKVIFVILNDSALGMVKHGQCLSNAEPVGYALPLVDFAALAKAQGICSYVIESDEDLLKINIKEICARQGPTVLDVRIDPDEIPPMHSRIRALKAH